MFKLITNNYSYWKLIMNDLLYYKDFFYGPIRLTTKSGKLFLDNQNSRSMLHYQPLEWTILLQRKLNFK
ncbi:hypothetical protein CR513_48849, partial [Mucuna pruriens]